MVRHVITAVLKKTLDPSESPDSLLQDSKGKKIMSFVGSLKMEDPKSKQIPSMQSTKVSGHFETISGGGNKTSSIVIHGKIEEIPGVDWCLRCGDQVYPLEKLEPCPGQFYHERCFRCYECGTKLSLATFCKNLQITQDPRVYCRTHQPKLDKSFCLDSSTLIIANALKNTKEMKVQPHNLQPAGKIARNSSYGTRHF